MLRRLALALGLGLCVCAQAVEVPAGVYALSPARQPVADELLTSPAVAGVVLRGEWPDVEPQDGRFDWRYFDEQMDRVARAGKVASLVITSGGRSVPDWLGPKLGPTLKFTDRNKYHASHGSELGIPVFWDPALIERKKKLIAAMGERYAKRPELRLVSVQCANATTDDWNIPGDDGAAEAWKAAGFSEARVLDACKSLIDATAAAFPNQALRMALGRVPRSLAADGDALARAIVRHGNERAPGRFFAQRHNLQARTPGPAGGAGAGWGVIAEACPTCAAQFLWPATDTRTCRGNGGQSPCDAVAMFRAAADIAIAYKLRYVEVYGADVRNPVLTLEVERLAKALAGGTKQSVAVPDAMVVRVQERDVRPRPGARAPGQGQGAGPPPAPGVQHLSFPSKAYGGPRNYSIWLPDSYAGSSDKRYPVLYWLHGKNGDPKRSSHLAVYLQRAIADGRMPETIMVFVDGDRDRFYSDDAQGRSPVETMFIDELIPYIDATYRTRAERGGRMIEGFSMGGFGALKFAAKYPDRFASVVAYGAPQMDNEQGMGRRDATTYSEVFGDDAGRFQRNTPPYLFRTNKDRILALGLRIRLVAGSDDGTRHSVAKLHEVLDGLGIPHEYAVLPGVRHAPGMYYEQEAGAGFLLHAKALGAK